MTVVSLADLAADPSKIDRLDGPTCGDVLIELSAFSLRLGRRLAMARVISAEKRTGDAREAALVLGLKPATLYKLAKRDPAYVALTVDTGTDRVVWDLEACRAFVDANRRSSSVVPMVPRTRRLVPRRPGPVA